MYAPDFMQYASLDQSSSSPFEISQDPAGTASPTANNIQIVKFQQGLKGI